jgi:hypothetical protein
MLPLIETILFGTTMIFPDVLRRGADRPCLRIEVLQHGAWRGDPFSACYNFRRFVFNLAERREVCGQSSLGL